MSGRIAKTGPHATAATLNVPSFPLEFCLQRESDKLERTVKDWIESKTASTHALYAMYHHWPEQSSGLPTLGFYGRQG